MDQTLALQLHKDICDENGISLPMNEMTFYYDESGNCRKFSLTEDGVNSKDALKYDFVLAGVAYMGHDIDIDYGPLYKAVNYKDGQSEIKFKHLYRKNPDFLSFMEKEATRDFLSWLMDSDLYIHYCTMNNLYYSIVDIVDSLGEDYPKMMYQANELKSALYDFTIEHQEEILAILYRYGYPNITEMDAFCDSLAQLISENNDDSDYYPGFFLECLRQMLISAGKKESMVFLQDNTPNLLIEEYSSLYYMRCIDFLESTHIFDEEPYVQKKFEDTFISFGINNYEFTPSHKHILIQTSDIICGLLRKLFAFLDDLSISEAIQLRRSFSEVQKECFLLIWNLISKAEEKCVLLVKNINGISSINSRMQKLQWLAGR